jgi:hypothetical protein
MALVVADMRDKGPGRGAGREHRGGHPATHRRATSRPVRVWRSPNFWRHTLTVDGIVVLTRTYATPSRTFRQGRCDPTKLAFARGRETRRPKGRASCRRKIVHLLPRETNREGS